MSLELRMDILDLYPLFALLSFLIILITACRLFKSFLVLILWTYTPFLCRNVHLISVHSLAELHRKAPQASTCRLRRAVMLIFLPLTRRHRRCNTTAATANNTTDVCVVSKARNWRLKGFTTNCPEKQMTDSDLNSSEYYWSTTRFILTIENNDSGLKCLQEGSCCTCIWNILN